MSREAHVRICGGLEVQDEGKSIDGGESFSLIAGLRELISSPIPDIRANNSNGPVSLGTGEQLIVIVTLDPDDQTDQDADLWIFADSPTDIYSSVYPDGRNIKANFLSDHHLFLQFKEGGKQLNSDFFREREISITQQLENPLFFSGLCIMEINELLYN